jgi:hypothetical protein
MRRIVSTAVLTAFLTIATGSAAHAAGPQLYVSPTGSDSRSCTQTSPCRSLNRANALASAGSIVHVAPGSYSPAKLTKTGTPTSRITYRSTTKWGAKLSGCQTTILEATGAYTDLVGFDVTGCGGSTWNGIGLAGSYTRAIGNRVHHIARGCNPNGAIVTYTGTDQEVIGNYVHDVGVGADNTCQLYHGVYLSRPRNKAINNLVVRALGNGIESYHAATNLTIVNNTVYDVGTNGFVLAASSGSSNTNTIEIIERTIRLPAITSGTT